MKYLLLYLCAALELIQQFNDLVCTRSSIFSLQIDSHYDETILSALVHAPSFLLIEPRYISQALMQNLNFDYEIDIKSMEYNENSIIILESASILIFSIENPANPRLTQRYMDKAILKYDKISMGRVIVLSNLNSFAVFTLDMSFPQLIAEVFIEENVSSIGIISDIIIICTKNFIKTYQMEDIDLGYIKNTKKILPSDLGLKEFEISDIYTNESVYILENHIGLFELNLTTANITHIFNIYGNKLAGFNNYLIVDGKYEIDCTTLKVVVYNITTKCEYLKIDFEFIYCGHQNKLFYLSRLVPIVSESFYDPIKSVLVDSSIVFVADRNSVDISFVSLGPIVMQGRVPDQIDDYEVEFTVWSSGSQDTQKFKLSIQYSITDVILFILYSLGGVAVFIASFGLGFKYCKKKKIENLPIVINSDSNLVPSNSPHHTERVSDRNVFSARVLIHNLK